MGHGTTQGKNSVKPFTTVHDSVVNDLASFRLAPFYKTKRPYTVLRDGKEQDGTAQGRSLRGFHFHHSSCAVPNSLIACFSKDLQYKPKGVHFDYVGGPC